MALIRNDVPERGRGVQLNRTSTQILPSGGGQGCGGVGAVARGGEKSCCQNLSVSSRHERAPGDKLEVCLQRCVRSVLSPHHSRIIVRRGSKPKSNARGACSRGAPMIYVTQKSLRHGIITHLCALCAIIERQTGREITFSLCYMRNYIQCC